VKEENNVKSSDCYLCATPRERMSRMIGCPTCGNKRCPRGTDHRLDCTGSNEPDQPGSRYAEGWKEPEQASGIKYTDFKPKWMDSTDPEDEILRNFAGHVSSIPEEDPTPTPEQQEIARLRGALRDAVDVLRGWEVGGRAAQWAEINTPGTIDKAVAALGEEEG
jgi:hypothetical protein